MSAYNDMAVGALTIVKQARAWAKQNIITVAQRDEIIAAFPVNLYHPNLFVRLALLVATLFALGGVTGMLGLMISTANPGTGVISFLCVLYGIASFVVLESVFISSQRHFKSGVTEALLYHAVSFTVVGMAGLFDFNSVGFTSVVCLLVFAFAAVRYLDMIATAATVGAAAWLVFYALYQMGDLARQLLPFVLMMVAGPSYFVLRRRRLAVLLETSENCMILAEALTLLIFYAAGNYLVVRELSVSLLSMQLAPGENIPFAWLFYALTVMVPVGYLFAGIRYRDVVLLRVGLAVIAFSAFTFKYYYSLGHHEITLTSAGLVLLGVSLWVMRYLRTPKQGITRENVLTEKWGGANVAAVVMSQTLGGNKMEPQDTGMQGDGGSFGGGGSSGSF